MASAVGVQVRRGERGVDHTEWRHKTRSHCMWTVRLIYVNPLPTSDYHHLPKARKNLYGEFNIRLCTCHSASSTMGTYGCYQV